MTGLGWALAGGRRGDRGSGAGQDGHSGAGRTEGRGRTPSRGRAQRGPLRPMGAPRSLVFWCLLSVVLTQRVKVRNEVTGYVGDEATLQCLFPTTSSDVKVSQVTWMKEMGGKKQNVAVYLPDHKPNFPLDNSGRIRFLNVSLQDATLIIQPLRMGDEGTYICEFATYPHGNEDGVTTLSILARPTNTAESRKVVAGNAMIPVAVCTSANGKPPARITWIATLPGNFNASEVANGDGTVTVTSQFNMVPTAVADQEQITCVISQRTLTEPENIPVTLSVLYPPQVTIEGYDDNWYVSRNEAVLRCVAKGNPKPTHYSWSTPSGPLPPTVQVQGDRLLVQSVDVAVNTTFICQVTNSVGTTRVEQIILVREHPTRLQSSAGAVAGGLVGGILALALLGALVFFLLRRRRARPPVKGAYDPTTRVYGNGAPHNFTYRPDSELDRPLKAAPGEGAPGEWPGPYGYPGQRHEEEEEEERLDEVGPMLRLSAHPGHSAPSGYEDDDMESQHDGSIISKTAVYV
ncbi:nectin-2 isoform X2 [Caretta caretta]|uniref:nectin-2 isoform X2 n=1 Tax=Caretta caretta TaxID=8467 RepID=UPI0020963D1B|nr:nectin-2 isoform X2 [Caretta caretta]